MLGETDWEPPAVGKSYLLPSVPVMLTWVAFAAVTVNVDEAPFVTVAGAAEMVTVGGAALALTFTVTLAVALPSAPVAVAVYEVVLLGETDWDPPVDCKVYWLPSVPAMLTWVAFVAATLSVEGDPATTGLGVAVMLTCGGMLVVCM